MSKLLHEISYDSDVGIWGSQTATARIYDDKIIVCAPYVKWLDNSGTLAFRKTAIRNQKWIAEVLADITDDCEDSAWDHIRRAQIDCIS